jgi:hypothetical protein
MGSGGGQGGWGEGGAGESGAGEPRVPRGGGSHQPPGATSAAPRAPSPARARAAPDTPTKSIDPHGDRLTPEISPKRSTSCSATAAPPSIS